MQVSFKSRPSCTLHKVSLACSWQLCEHTMPECSSVQSSVGFIWESNYTFFYTLCIELFKQYAECKICDLIAIAKLQYRDEILMTSAVRAAASATTKSKRDGYHSQSLRLSVCLSVSLSFSLSLSLCLSICLSLPPPSPYPLLKMSVLLFSCFALLMLSLYVVKF